MKKKFLFASTGHPGNAAGIARRVGECEWAQGFLERIAHISVIVIDQDGTDIDSFFRCHA